MAKIPLVAVVGPTASGKTQLAIELCRALDGEVISGDSMQLYKGLSIATAKPTAQEQSAAVHHLIDLIEPCESFSVAQYTQLAHCTVQAVHARGKLPVLAGGTGLYIRSLTQNIAFTPQQQDETYRQGLHTMAEEQGTVAVHSLLAAVDPASATAIHPNNLGRVIRALEVYHTTGRTMTAQQAASRSQPSPYSCCMLGLGYRERQTLNARINLRVELMISNGLVEEAVALQHAKLSPTAAQAIGYKELLPYLEGDIALGQAVEDIKLRSRQYAKRQMTWFMREPGIHWLWAEDYQSPQALAQAATSYAKEWLARVQPKDVL